MKISKDLCNYLNSSYKFINSNILMSDLKKIILTYTFNLDSYYINKNLDIDILSIIDEYKKYNCFNDNYIWVNNHFCKIIEYDKLKYSGQIIFPIYHNQSLDGLLIFFRQNYGYIASSCKAPKTTREFVELMSDDNY